MAYCEERAIPHSEFLGRVVGPGEPRWLTEDRAKVMAYRLEKAARCQKCGTAQWEWDEDPDAYSPTVVPCIGCQRINVADEEVRRSGHSTSSQVTLIPRRAFEKLTRLPARRPKRRKRGR